MGSDSKKQTLKIKDRVRIGPSHQCSKEQPYPLIIQNCLKVTQDLSKEVARYSNLVIGLGGSQDCQILREELRLIRLKSYNLAQQNMNVLAQFLQRRKKPVDTEHTEIDKLLQLFSTTLEIFLSHLIRTVYLLDEFSFCNSSQEMKLINTGITEPLMGLKSSQTLLTLSSVKQLSEEEEMKLVESQVSDLEFIVEQINQSIDHRPWELPNCEDTANLVNNIGSRSSRTISNAGNSTQSFLQALFTCSMFPCSCLQRQQRWYQIMILIGLVILVLSGSILGIYCSIRIC